MQKKIYLTRLIDCDAAYAVRVTGVSNQTITGGQVIDHLTLGVLAASAGTWVTAFLVDTCLIRRAVRVQNALGTTAIIRISEVIRQTLAGSGPTTFLALGIHAAGTGVAGLQNFRRTISYWTTLTKRISGEATVTQAHGTMTEHPTNGILTT